MDKKKWIVIAVAVLLALTAVLLIIQRTIPMELSDLMPEGFQPEQCRVLYSDWMDSMELTEAELQTLLTHLESLEYRYDGRVPGGIMTGKLYHLSFFQPKPDGLVNIFVTTRLGIVYMNDREYEMLGDTKPLLEFLGQLK